MPKPFYSMEEVSAMLGKDTEAIRKMVRDGALREFRDAGKVFFKAEDVDKLTKGGKGPAKSDTGEIILEPADDELPSLVDASSGTSIIGLESVAEKPRSKEDTAITSTGIGVFEDDELEVDADPMAKTQITSAGSDQVSLEGTGSGSGLLDLTREADDTSLGAELLDEIYPGEEEQAAAPQRAARPREEPALEEAEQGEVLEPVYVTVGDPSEGLFDGLLVGAVLLLATAGSVVAAVMQGFLPSYARTLSDNFWFFLLGGVLAVGISVLVGWLIGRSGSKRRVA